MEYFAMMMIIIVIMIMVVNINKFFIIVFGVSMDI